MYAITSREFSEFRQPLSLQLHFIAPLQVSAHSGRYRTSIAWGLQALAKLTPPGWQDFHCGKISFPIFFLWDSDSVGYQKI
jgi:hypothetical protein